MSLKSTFIRIPSNKNISQSFHIGCGTSDDLSFIHSVSRKFREASGRTAVDPLCIDYKLCENIILLDSSSSYIDNDELEYEKIDKEEQLYKEGYFTMFNQSFLEIFLNVGKALLEQQKEK